MDKYTYYLLKQAAGLPGRTLDLGDLSKDIDRVYGNFATSSGNMFGRANNADPYRVRGINEMTEDYLNRDNPSPTLQADPHSYIQNTYEDPEYRKTHEPELVSDRSNWDTSDYANYDLVNGAPDDTEYNYNDYLNDDSMRARAAAEEKLEPIPMTPDLLAAAEPAPKPVPPKPVTAPKEPAPKPVAAPKEPAPKPASGSASKTTAEELEPTAEESAIPISLIAEKYKDYNPSAFKEIKRLEEQLNFLNMWKDRIKNAGGSAIFDGVMDMRIVLAKKQLDNYLEKSGLRVFDESGNRLNHHAYEEAQDLYGGYVGAGDPRYEKYMSEQQRRLFNMRVSINYIQKQLYDIDKQIGATPDPATRAKLSEQKSKIIAEKKTRLNQYAKVRTDFVGALRHGMNPDGRGTYYPSETDMANYTDDKEFFDPTDNAITGYEF